MIGLLNDDSGAPTYSKYYYYKVQLGSGWCESGERRMKKLREPWFLLT